MLARQVAADRSKEGGSADRALEVLAFFTECGSQRIAHALLPAGCAAGAFGAFRGRGLSPGYWRCC